MSQTKPTYEELKQRCHAAEAMLAAIRSGQTDTIIGEQGVLVLRLAEAEKALRESEARYRLLAENMADVVWILNARTLCFTYVSPSVERLRGYSVAEVMAQPMEQVMTPDSLVQVSTGLPGRIQAFLAGDPAAVTQMHEVEQFRKDGSTVWTEVVTTLLRNEAGEIEVLGVSRDISTRKQAEKISQIKDKLLQLTGEMAQVGGWEFDATTFEGTWTDEVAHIYDLDPEQATNVELGVSFYLPESRQKIEQAVKEAIELARPYDLELEMVSATGRHKWVRTMGLPITEGSRVVKVRGIFQDITARKQAERELRIVLEKYQVLFDTFPLGISVTDAVGNLLEANQESERLLGISRHDHLRRTYDGPEWRIVRPDGSPMPPDEFASVRALQEKRLVENVEIGIVKGSGETTWISVTAAPLAVEGYGVVITYGDITERKRAEAEIKLARAFLEMVIDMSPFAMWISDKEGMVMRVNRSLCEAINLTEAEIVGKYNVLKDANLDSQGVMPRVRAVFEKHEFVRFSIPWGATEVGHVDFKGGRDMYIDVSMFPILNGQGELTNVVCQWVDITERKRAEEALRESEERYRKLLELAPVAIAVHSGGKIVFINPAGVRLLGAASEEELIGRSVLAIIHPAGLKQVQERIPRLLAGEQGLYPAEDVYVKLDGTPINVEVTVTPLSYQGKPAFQAIVTDITERKRAETALQETLNDLKRSNAELEQFAYVASHDLQEPLRAVTGMVQLLQQRYQGQLDQRADVYINHAVEAAGRMQTLINDLLAFSRVGRRGQPFAPVNTATCVQLALKNLEVAIRESQARLTWDDLPTVAADSTQLSQLFQNLIGNSLKFRGEKEPQIHISAVKVENVWQFSVRDNGIGMEPQYFGRIFQVFQRLHTRQEYPGTGIGLALCQKIVERHGGAMWVESQVGQGSTFYFTLPIRSTPHDH